MLCSALDSQCHPAAACWLTTAPWLGRANIWTHRLLLYRCFCCLPPKMLLPWQRQYLIWFGLLNLKACGVEVVGKSRPSVNDNNYCRFPLVAASETGTGLGLPWCDFVWVWHGMFNKPNKIMVSHKIVQRCVFCCCCCCSYSATGSDWLTDWVYATNAFDHLKNSSRAFRIDKKTTKYWLYQY